MIRNFWKALFGQDIKQPEIIKFSKDHTLTERAINILRSAGVTEDSNWPAMVDRVRTALAAYAKLDELISSPLNIPTTPQVNEPKALKTTKTKTANKKVQSSKPTTESVVDSNESTNSDSKKSQKLPKVKTVKKPRTVKITAESVQRLDKKSVDQINN